MTGEQKGARRGFLRRRSLPSVALAGTTVLLLAGVVLLASLVPERRAARVSPLAAMRVE